MSEFSIKGITNAGTIIFGNADTAHKIVFVKALSSTNSVSQSDILSMDTVDSSDWNGPNGIVVSDLTNVVNGVARITVKFPAQSQEYRIKTVAVTAQLANVSSPIETIVSAQSDQNKTLFIPSTSSVQDAVYVRFNITINNGNPSAVVTPGAYASIGDYTSLNERAVTTHNKEDASIGDNQDILGEKHFNNNVIFSEGILIKDQDIADIRVQTKAQDIIPQSTLAYSLGDTNIKWSNVYATNFNGTATDAINLSYKSGSTVTPKLTANNTQVTAKTSIVPDTNDAYYLGSGQRKWNTLFCECVGDANWPVKWMYLSGGNDVDCGIELVESVEYSDESTIRPITNNCSTLGDSSHRYCQVWTTDCDIINLYTENIEVDNITVYNSIDVAGTASIAGAADFYGGIYSDGSISCDGDLFVGGTVTSNDIIPDSNNTHGLGSTSYRWKHIYANGNTNAYYLEIGNCTSVDSNSNIETSYPVIRPSTNGVGYIGTPNYHIYGAYINNLYIGSSGTTLSSYIANTTVTNSTNATNATKSNNIAIYGRAQDYNYPLVFAMNANSSTDTAVYSPLYTDTVKSLYYNPNTNTLTCPSFSGTASKATGDGNGNTIVSTYLKNVSYTTSSSTASGIYRSGATYNASTRYSDTSLTLTKGNNTTSAVDLKYMIARIIAGNSEAGSEDDIGVGAVRIVTLKTSATWGRFSDGWLIAGSILAPAKMKTQGSDSSNIWRIDNSDQTTSSGKLSGTWKILHGLGAHSSGNCVVALAVRVV